MKYTFEDFLMEIHGKQCLLPGDDWPDDFVNWTDDISYDDWIDYGDKFAKAINAELLGASKIILGHYSMDGTCDLIKACKKNPVLESQRKKLLQAIAKAEE